MGFTQDWSHILKLEENNIRTLDPLNRGNWSLRVFLYSDDAGIGCDTYCKGQSLSDQSARIDGFFPDFKPHLKERLREIHELIHVNEDEAKRLLVALPEYLAELLDESL